jgi:broad specificity phosphatase PhoE
MLPEVESQVAEASRVSNQLPIIYLARHGETAWTVTGQHTGRTDLALTEAGERNARRVRDRLKGLTFAKVFTSPLQRAVRTCELAGLVRSPKSMTIWWSGTTASMRVSLQLRFARRIRPGSFSGMVAPEVSPQSRLRHGPIVW